MSTIIFLKFSWDDKEREFEVNENQSFLDAIVEIAKKLNFNPTGVSIYGPNRYPLTSNDLVLLVKEIINKFGNKFEIISDSGISETPHGYPQAGPSPGVDGREQDGLFAFKPKPQPGTSGGIGGILKEEKEYRKESENSIDAIDEDFSLDDEEEDFGDHVKLEEHPQPVLDERSNLEDRIGVEETLSSAPSGPSSDESKKEKETFEESFLERKDEVTAIVDLPLPTPTPTPKPPPPISKSDQSPKTTIERRASIIYWERMKKRVEYDLIVSLHKPEIDISTPLGASIAKSHVMSVPKEEGRVRITPICTGCNISPVYREMTIKEYETDKRTDFKVLPTEVGKYGLTVEFEFIKTDGSSIELGEVKTEVAIQEEDIEFQLDGIYTFKVSRRIPAIFSIIGSFFGFGSFILATVFGIDLQESLLESIAAISSAVAALILITLGLLMLWKGLKPLKREIEISLRSSKTFA